MQPQNVHVGMLVKSTSGKTGEVVKMSGLRAQVKGGDGKLFWREMRQLDQLQEEIIGLRAELAPSLQEMEGALTRLCEQEQTATGRVGQAAAAKEELAAAANGVPGERLSFVESCALGEVSVGCTCSLQSAISHSL